MYIVGDGVSSPAAINGWIPEWPKGTDCKSAANSFGGSNPPSPTSVPKIWLKDISAVHVKVLVFS